MRKNWFAKIFRVIFLVAFAGVLFGFVIESLWNWLMPALFHWQRIGYWQAIGLFLLSRILLGGIHHRSHRGSGRGHWKGHMWRRWQQMSPDEQEEFRAGWRGCRSPKSEPVS